MKKRDQNRLDSFRLVAKFGADRKTKFPAAKLSGKTFAEVAAAAAGMEAADNPRSRDLQAPRVRPVLRVRGGSVA